MTTSDEVLRWCLAKLRWTFAVIRGFVLAYSKPPQAKTALHIGWTTDFFRLYLERCSPVPGASKSVVRKSQQRLSWYVATLPVGNLLRKFLLALSWNDVSQNASYNNDNASVLKVQTPAIDLRLKCQISGVHRQTATHNARELDNRCHIPRSMSKS